jgi:hypothetical protein
MKLWLPLLAAILLSAGCKPQGDAKVRRNLPGSWIAAGNYPEGGRFTNTITVDPTGGYVCHVAAYGTDGILRTSDLAGKFEVRDGMLIDTMTRHSNTNAPLPSTSRCRIVRFDGRELVITLDESVRGNLKTNEVVLRKQGS